MNFTKKASNTVEPHILILRQRLIIVKEFKYLGIVLNSNLSFKIQKNPRRFSTMSNITWQISDS